MVYSNVNNFTYSIKYVINTRTRKSFIPEERKKQTFSKYEFILR